LRHEQGSGAPTILRNQKNTKTNPKTRSQKLKKPKNSNKISTKNFYFPTYRDSEIRFFEKLDLQLPLYTYVKKNLVKIKKQESKLVTTPEYGLLLIGTQVVCLNLK